jgi:predicted dehydrogenase
VDVFCDKGVARIPFYGKVVVTSGGQVVDLDAYRPLRRIGMFTLAYDQIADHIDGGPPPFCTGRDGAMVHEIVMAAAESILTGARVAVPTKRRGLRVWSVGKVFENK